MNNYESFLTSPTQKQWKRIGTERRAGVGTPLFSLYSKESIGVGEFRDLKLLIDWCKKVGISIIQLLPMNDVGYDFRPYDSQSSFALEPLYLSLEDIHGVDSACFKDDFERLKNEFPLGKGYVHYGIKGAKLEVLWKMFETFDCQNPDFKKFCDRQEFWLDRYALYKVAKEKHDQAAWWDWPEALRKKEESALESLRKEKERSIEFWQWLQWQAYEQFREAKKYGAEQSVLIMGDLPFLVSRDSADVWSRQNYFKLDLAAGAPPDHYFIFGQRWGMPPYDWNQIAGHEYDYVVQKVKYAENFYDLFRIDHVAGAFRIWTMAADDRDDQNVKAAYDPADESTWKEHGQKILSVMIENTRMLPCAEDLGTVPDCAFEVLKDYGIPGMDIQRWMRDWKKTGDFKAPDQYRPHAIGMLSTHDIPSFEGWWQCEAGSVDEGFIRSAFTRLGIDFEEVKEQLFDLNRMNFGRLHWQEKLKSSEDLLSVLQKPESEVYDILNAFQTSVDEEAKFCQWIGFEGVFDQKNNQQKSLFVEKALMSIQSTASIFSIQLLQDWFSLDPRWNPDAWNFRINFPGTSGIHNWSIAMPFSLDEMLESEINQTIRNINEKTNRI